MYGIFGLFGVYEELWNPSLDLESRRIGTRESVRFLIQWTIVHNAELQ